jgi:Fur family ferric uptake transcriptional regulator
MSSMKNKSRKEVSKTLLASKNISITKPRLVLLEILLGQKRPLTVDQVVKLSKGKMALSSLYRVINDLRDLRVIAEFQTPDNTKVIELIDHQDRHHHHIFCGSCGSVTDFEINDQLERDLEKEIQKVEVKYSLSVISHSLELLSLCARCMKK